MKTWYRTAPLDTATAVDREERWELREGTRTIVTHTVAVRVGKPLDVVALKRTSLSDTEDYARYLEETARRLYGADRRSPAKECPCCGFDTATAKPAVVVFDVPYHRCEQCGHGFVLNCPDDSVLNEVFAESEAHSSTYTDEANAQIRLQQIVAPKIEWLTEVFGRHYRRIPKTALDVGAGAGHFVAGLRRAGISAHGYELSRSSRAFAAKVFGVELDGRSFTEEPPRPGDYDVITFWGLLEYVAEPRRFLEAARRWLNPGAGMLVIEVPRFDCMSTAIQTLLPGRVARHLDPTSHVNCFSDGSIASALEGSGFKPVAAWYFGMDAYELLAQLAMLLEDHGTFDRLAHLIPSLQESLDGGLLCDDIVVAGVPA